MTTLILDFESYYDSEYSLKKMTTPAYILDPRWETIMVAAKVDNGEHQIIDGPDFPQWLKQFDPAKTTTVTFNALFDCSILAWRYGFVPALMIDAMGLARALLGHELARFSLKSVAEHLELGAKGDALANMMGKRREQIKAEGLWDSFCAYALQDNVLCEGITKRLLSQLPPDELRIMDLVLRCAVEPSFVCDVDMLRAHMVEVKQAKEQLLNSSRLGRIELMSSAKFQAALEGMGVEVKMKTSPTGRTVPQLAKTDPFMAELLEHDNPAVQTMAAARLGMKSTLEETRTEKFISIAELPWPRKVEPAIAGNGYHYVDTPNLPIPLRYGGAHTHRLSGDWGLNFQNLPADRKKDGKSKLRASLKAPEGHSIIVADLGQIECRLSAWICKAGKLLGQFADKQDPYAILATAVFGRLIDRKVDFIEGFIGKTGILGLGYGCGKDNFHTMVTRSARVMEIDISEVYTRDIGDAAVDAYRRLHKEIPAGWRRLDNILSEAWLKGNTMKFGPCTISKGVVELPNKMELRYADPQRDYETNELSYRYGRTRHKIYGAKFLENIVQALARVVVMNAAQRLYNKGLRFVLQAHDELVFVVRHNCVDEAKKLIHDEMICPPSWAPDLPLTADVNHGANYGSAK